MNLLVNNLLKGRYRIESVLGQGGMGAVYQAIDELLGTPVAVKENLFLSEEYTEQFKQETRILASLRHVNLPRVLDFCSIEGQGQYLVMDYIAGEDLRDLLKRSGPLSESDVVLIGYHICEALDYMHSQQPMVVHRDIKPGNIKLTENNEVYLVDFGLAKQTSSRSQMTMTGARAMTPGFSPPEQYGTARTDERSDIYSLGATLYNALTGAVPEDALDRVTDRNDLTPILNHRRNTERRLVKVVEKAMSLLPEDRYQSAKEFQDALLHAARMQSITTDVKKLHYFDLNKGEDLEKEENIKPKSSGVRKSKSSKFFPSKNNSWLGWAFLSLLLIAAVGLAFIRSDRVFDMLSSINFFTETPTTVGFVESTSTEVSLPTVTSTTIPTTPIPTIITETPTPTGESTFTVTVSPTATSTDVEEEAVLATATSTPTQNLTPTTVVLGIQDEYPIVFASNRNGNNQLWLMDQDGDEKIQLTSMVGGACQPKWSPDGSQIVFVSPCQNSQDEYPESILYVYSFSDKSIIALLEIEDANQKIGNFDPEWSPDGSKILYTSLLDGLLRINIYDILNKEVSVISSSEYNDFHPSWHPDGQSIVFVRQNGYSSIWQVSIDGSDPIKVSNSGNVENFQPVWDEQGRFILFSQRNEAQVPWLVKFYAGNFGSALEEKIVFENITGSFPALAPVFTIDSTEVLFESWPDGRNHDIYRVNVDGTGLTRLTTNSGYDFDPDFYHNYLSITTDGEE